MIALTNLFEPSEQQSSIRQSSHRSDKAIIYLDAEHQPCSDTKIDQDRSG